jgi:hypothetical protein
MGSDRGDTWRRGREEARSVASGRRRSKLSHWQRPARLGEGEIHLCCVHLLARVLQASSSCFIKTKRKSFKTTMVSKEKSERKGS